MGLNLLIGILVVLILLILADGLRRVWRERQGRLRLKIEARRVPDGDVDVDLHNPELPSGGARTIRRNTVTDRAAPGTDAAASVMDSAPPVMMEADDRPAPAAAPAKIGPASQNELFSHNDDDDDQALPSISALPDEAEEEEKPEPRAGARAETAAAQRPSAPASKETPPSEPAMEEVLDVIVVHLVAPRGERFPGRDLLEQLLENGLRFGEMNIFHHHQNDTLQFSMANAVEPGTFDIDEMDKQEFAGVTFFLKLPGPARPVETLDKMFAVVRKLVDQLGGELKDEQRSVLTPQTMEHLRQRVQEFERRQRLARSH